MLLPGADNAVGHEKHEQDGDDADDEQGRLAEGVGEPVAEQLQHAGAQRGTDQGANAADDGHEQRIRGMSDGLSVTLLDNSF